MRRGAIAILASFLVLLAMVGVAAAAYPPGTFPGAAPGGAFRTVVMSRVLCAAGGSLQASYDRSSLVLQVPAGAFKQCTQLSIYAAETAVISPMIPQGELLVDAFAVGWDLRAPSSKPLTLTINDPAITAGATIFETTTTGITRLSDVKVQAGAVTMTFLTAPGYVVTMTTSGASPSPSTVSGPSVFPSVAVAVASSGSSGPSGAVLASGGGPGWGALVVVLALIAVGLTVLAIVRYRRASRRV